MILPYAIAAAILAANPEPIPFRVDPPQWVRAETWHKADIGHWVQAGKPYLDLYHANTNEPCRIHPGYPESPLQKAIHRWLDNREIGLVSSNLVSVTHWKAVSFTNVLESIPLTNLTREYGWLVRPINLDEWKTDNGLLR